MTIIKTFQDLEAAGENERNRMDFVLSAIAEHKNSDAYRTASAAMLYYKHQNPTIMQAQKIVYDLLGRAQRDQWSANNKVPSRWFFYFVTQTVQFLLGNGISFTDDSTLAKLGPRFEYTVQQALTKALIGGVSYGFWADDRLRLFDVCEFVPLLDGDTGSLKAGIRFWQLDAKSPLRAVLYEIDGYTEYTKQPDDEMQVAEQKRSYIQNVARSEATGEEITEGRNYPNFPIIPLYNINHQSEIVGNRETIDAYDLMASALINNIDDANIIYWVIKNAGGTEGDMDDLKFIQRLKTIHVAHTEGDQEVDAHTVEVPFQASEAALARLRSQLFDDFMALDVKEISGGAATATQIRAAYEPLNNKADLLEWEVTDFIEQILMLAGIDDTPSYTRSFLVNQQEAIQSITTAGQDLSQEYRTKKILEILGDADKYDEVMAQKIADEATRYADVE